MDSISIGRLVSIAVLLLTMPYYWYRIYQYREDPSRRIFIMISFVHVLLLPQCFNAFLEALRQPVPRGMNILGHITMPLSILMGYFAVDQFLHEKIYSVVDIVKARISLITFAGIGLLVALTVTRAESTSFTDSAAFDTSPVYLTGYGIYYLLLSFLSAAVAWLFWKDLAENNETSYIVRRLTCAFGALLAAFFCLVAELNMVLSLITANPYQAFINWLVQDFGRGLAFVFLLLGFACPEALFARLIRPIDLFVQRRRTRHQQRLEQLHQSLIRIAPVVQLTAGTVHRERVLTEIAHARRIIWTNIPRAGRITARDEADTIAKLLNDQIVFTKAGKEPPLPRQANAIKHYLTIEKHLRETSMASQSAFQAREEVSQP